jgi:hypothetical protein
MKKCSHEGFAQIIMIKYHQSVFTTFNRPIVMQEGDKKPVQQTTVKPLPTIKPANVISSLPGSDT